VPPLPEAPELEPIIRRCLEKKPADRFQDVGALALGAECQALGDAKAVLFVDYHKTEFVKLDGFLDKSMRPHYYLNLALGDGAIECLPRRTFDAPGQEPDPHAKRRQQVLECFGVLGRQNFGWRHKGSLKTLVCRLTGSQASHHCLTGPDVALKQPVHRRLFLEIL